ncbi:hypothetical protein LQ567_25875 [Niabella pedocola]|uniref:Uncharacterized protein n=1 Tax=Niabella pedocola TaxID=1752077 RepID=A0ABS8PYU5_9BACT|nr:hypothetical protein [Niabella pedocola]MCD2426241.1 hypothetical protein [Niabella pedocola]
MEQHKLYGIEFNLPVPSEVLVNDMPVSKNFVSGTVGPEFINQYILDAGKQRVRIKVMHPFLKEGGLFTGTQLKKLTENIQVQLVDVHQDYKVTPVAPLHFPEVKEPVPFFEYEWTFDAGVDYRIQGWKNSTDLKKIDENLLTQEVLTAYQRLYTELDKGDTGAFQDEIKQAEQELFSSNYYSKEKIAEHQSNCKTFYSNHKGRMLPIENYRMVFYANGKAVALERVDEAYAGLGVLIAKGTEENAYYTNSVVLHKPSANAPLQVLRINSEYIKMHK